MNSATECRVTKDDGELKAVIQIVQHEQTDHQEYISHTRGEECLLGCGSSTGLLPIESNQEIGTQTHNLPEDEQPQEVVRKHHPEHTHAEQNEFGEKAVIAILIDGVSGHVTNREPTNEKT